MRPIRTGTFSLPAQQVAIDATNLSPNPIVASGEIECALNNTVPANAPIATLDGAQVQIPGAGTAMGYQTLSNFSFQCNDGSFATTLNNAIAAGGQFTETETDGAFTNLPACSPCLTNALTQLLAIGAPTLCQY